MQRRGDHGAGVPDWTRSLRFLPEPEEDTESELRI